MTSFLAHICLAVLTTSWLSVSSYALANFNGPVISVLEGDTIEVLHNTHPERVRLSGIDCPEKGQAHGKKTSQAVSHIAFEKEVTLKITDIPSTDVPWPMCINLLNLNRRRNIP